MKGVTVILDQLNGRKAAALLRDGKLDDLLIDAPEGTPLPGAIYRAKVGGATEASADELVKAGTIKLAGP